MTVRHSPPPVRRPNRCKSGKLLALHRPPNARVRSWRPSRKAKSPVARGHRPSPDRWRENVSFARLLPAAQTPPTYRYVATPTSSPPVSPGTAAVVLWPSPGIDYEEQLSSRPGAWGTHRLALPPSPSPHPAESRCRRRRRHSRYSGHCRCRRYNCSRRWTGRLPRRRSGEDSTAGHRGRLYSCRRRRTFRPTRRRSREDSTAGHCGRSRCHCRRCRIHHCSTPHVGPSPTKGARDGGHGPVGSMKTRCSGLPDLTFAFLGTARLIAFASPQPSPDAVTTPACGCMGIGLRVVA